VNHLIEMVTLDFSCQRLPRDLTALHASPHLLGALDPAHGRVGSCVRCWRSCHEHHEALCTPAATYVEGRSRKGL